MFEYNSKRVMTYAVMASLALHAGLVLPALLSFDSRKDKGGDLQVELYGMIADRQLEEQAPPPMAEKLPPPPPPKAVSPQNKPKAQPQQVTQRQSKQFASESPVQVPDSAPNIAPTPPSPAPQQMVSADASSNSDQLQKQQTLKMEDERKTRLKQYLAALKKRIKSKLIYPQDARKHGYEGTPIVKFTLTESGTIKPGTLMVARSCGYPDLDANALQATKDSEPFDPPPKAINVVIDVDFVLND